MRYRITNLTRHHDSDAAADKTVLHPGTTVDLTAVSKAVAEAAARGESLYIRPVRPALQPAVAGAAAV
ncbi:hypothetical protein [Yinghuangia seranimata]|uniref:hypothetical protein n=1 Tax=Yinghuangia seranimata TaxID=408067 RepID=UPI00248CFFA8|nr:hypothetical protein [Yinghuangia seranimata]MDI2131012.1 hypothetical protein [Yinghuangia seranimata]